MARAADGTMTLSGTFAIANTIPVSSTINGYISDITTEITDSLSRSGKGAMLTHLAMGAYKINNLGDGAVLTDAASIKQVQNRSISFIDGGGTADAITATYSPAITAVVDGMTLFVEATAANATTTPTFAPSGLTARTIKKLHGQALAVGDISGDGHVLELQYHASGTYWNLLNPATASSLTGGAVSATSLAASTTFKLTGIISPTQLVANTDNWAPTGYATNAIWRVTTDATVRTITGIDATAAGGGFLLLVNANTSTAFILADETTSTAANQIMTPNSVDYYVRGGGAVLLMYDTTSSRWRILQPFDLATQATMEAAASPVSTVSPLNQHYHPGHPKFWAFVTVSGGTPTLQTSYNVTSITDTGVGDMVVTIATDFSGANWCLQATVELGASNAGIAATKTGTVAAGTVSVLAFDAGGVARDPGSWNVLGLGDQ